LGKFVIAILTLKLDSCSLGTDRTRSFRHVTDG